MPTDDGRGDPVTYELLLAAMKGDLAAQQRVLETQRRPMLAYARRHPAMPFLRRHASEEDLVAEAFLRALGSGLLAHLEDRGRGSLARALHVVLDRTIAGECQRYGALKRARGSTPLPLDAVDPDSERGACVVSRDPSPTSAARRSELAEVCRRMLREREWTAWSLVELEGLDSPSAALQMKTTPAAVRSLVRQARNRLEPHLRAMLDHGPA